MKKILMGILALSLLGIAFVAFAQKVGRCEQAGYTWSVEQGKCVIIDKEHGCLGYEVWSEGQGRCVIPTRCKSPNVWNNYQGRCVTPAKCQAPQVWSDEQGQCVNPAEPEEPEYDELVNVPSLEHFTLEEGDITDDDIYLVFAPKGNLDFRLNVYLHNEAGRDILDGWCTGDETLCKAVGNGRACPTLSIPGPSMSETVAPISNFSNRHTGENTWCYEGGSKSLKEAKVAEKVEKIEMVEKVKKLN